MNAATALARENARRAFLVDVWAGLSARAPNKSIPSKHFYDRRGSLLFEQITHLPEYDLARNELLILRAEREAIVKELGTRLMLIELGSGSSRKTRLLLERLESGSIYVPVDLSEETLLEVAGRLRAERPGLTVLPRVADFTEGLALDLPRAPSLRRVVFFPGSTIGNAVPTEAVRLLRGIRALIAPNGALLLGVDRKKDRRLLERAYDDRAGVTAAFNLNLLRRINSELEGDFELERFQHRARYDERRARVEMALVSRATQWVRVAGRAFAFEKGEPIRTELSHKYDPRSLSSLARRAGIAVARTWSDPKERFLIALLVP